MVDHKELQSPIYKDMAKIQKKAPKKPIKQEVLHIRCSPEELSIFRHLADKAERSLSDWARRYLLEAAK